MLAERDPLNQVIQEIAFQRSAMLESKEYRCGRLHWVRFASRVANMCPDIFFKSMQAVFVVFQRVSALVGVFVHLLAPNVEGRHLLVDANESFVKVGFHIVQ